LYSGCQGSDSCAPGWIVACATVIGVCVEPGPACPSMLPAMMRTSAPPSDELTNAACSPSIAW
jgi:hypothetical protein